MNHLIKKNLSIIISIFFLISHSGCATIVSGESSDLKINSNPSGADVYINDIKMGSTPMIADLERKQRHIIKLIKEGYAEETRMTRKGFNWWFLGNIIFGGIIGIIIDFATGAVYSLQPENVNVSLTGKKTEPKKIVTDLTKVETKS